MSTYFNPVTQEYENFEAAVMEQLKRIDNMIIEAPEESEEAET